MPTTNDWGDVSVEEKPATNEWGDSLASTPITPEQTDLIARRENARQVGKENIGSAEGRQALGAASGEAKRGLGAAAESILNTINESGPAVRNTLRRLGVPIDVAPPLPQGGTLFGVTDANSPISRGVDDFVTGLYKSLTPENAAQMATMMVAPESAASKVIASKFMAQMAVDSPEQAAEFGKALGSGDKAGVTSSLLNFALSVAPAAHVALKADPAGPAAALARAIDKAEPVLPDESGTRAISLNSWGDKPIVDPTVNKVDEPSAPQTELPKTPLAAPTGDQTPTTTPETSKVYEKPRVEKVMTPEVEGSTEFVPEEPAKPALELDKPESVEQQKARLAAEKKTADEQAAKQSVVDRAGKPLSGGTGDLGQGDLLGGGDLFSSAPIKSMGGLVPGDPSEPVGKGLPQDEDQPQTESAKSDSPELTSIKNAWTDIERKAQDFQEATPAERRSFQETLDMASGELAKDPDAGRRLVDKLAKTPRAVDDVEDALILSRVVEIKTQLDKITDEVNSATDPSSLADAQGRRAVLRDDYLSALNAARNAGTATARGLNARRIIVRSDFSLERMVAEERANANAGLPLSDKQNAEIEALHKQIDDSEKAHSDYVAKTSARIDELEAEKTLKDIEIDTLKKNPPIPPHVKVIADRVKTYFDARAKKAFAELTSGSWDITGALPKLIDYGASKIASGVSDFVGWSAEMLADFPDKVEQLKPYLKQIFDAANKAHDDFLDKIAPGAKEMVKRVREAPLDEQKTDAIEKIKLKLETGKMDEITPLAKKLAKIAVQEGARGWRQVNNAVHAVLKELLPAWDYRDTLQAVSGQGKFTLPKMDEVSVALADAISQSVEIAKIQKVISGEPVKPTGYVRRLASDAKRRLTQIYENAKRKFGFNITSPEVQLRSALQARKTYLEHRMADLRYEINKKQRTIKHKAVTPTDSELDAMRSEYEKVKAEHKAVFGDRQMTDEQKLKMAVASMTKRADEFARRRAAQDFSSASKSKPLPETPELKAAKARLDVEQAAFEELRSLDEHFQNEQSQKDLQRKIDALKKSNEETKRKLALGDTATKPQQVNRPLANPEMEKLRQERDALNDQLAEARKKPESQQLADALQRKLDSKLKQIAEKRAKLVAGDTSTKVKAVNRPLQSEALEKAQQELDDLNDQMAKLRNPPKSPKERALAAFKTRLANHILDLQDKIQRGDYTKKPRQPVVRDAEAERLQAESNRWKKTFQTRQLAYEKANRTKVNKLFDLVADVRRFGVLSRIETLLKLADFSVTKLPAMMAAEVAGSVFSHVPGLRRIAAKANIEGGGSAPSIFKGIAKGLTKGIDDAWKTLAKGESDLKAAHSTRIPGPANWTHFFGLLHEAIKSPLRRAVFEYAMEKQLLNAAKHGVDASNPAVRMSMEARAYIESDRALLLENNRMAASIQQYFKKLEAPDSKTGRPSFGGKALATVGRTELPILTVPLNYAKQTLINAFGLFTGGAAVIKAHLNGVENLSSEEANQILRHLKYGTIGGALLLYGFYDGWTNGANGTFGGYYQPGEKRNDSQAGVGGMKIGNKKISGLALHNPTLATAQLGHTIGAIAKRVFSKTGSAAGGMSAGFVAGLFGLLHDSPIGHQTDTMSNLADPRRVQKTTGEFLRNHLEPGMVQEIAEHLDPTPGGSVITGPFVKRDPQTIKDELKVGIPGLRETVPTKIKKTAMPR